MDAVLLGLGNAVPGIENQQIVDAAVLQGERRQLDDIDKFARLDEHMLVRFDIDRAHALRGFRHGSGLKVGTATTTQCAALPLPSSHPNLLP